MPAECKEILGLNRITKKKIKELCKKDKLYQTPELNDVLYLHFQGFDCIECLEDYTELKCLWLESNAISEIQGLDKQSKLKCLFLQSNLIRKIENLEFCKELDTLNLSQNHIRKIENCGFEVLPVLNTLNLSSNYIKDSEGLKELENCKNLSVLDLSNNRIDDILVVKIFSRMPELKVLVLQGNPVVSKIPQYRKTLILECKNLTYLDSRPVFPKDRACAEAWKRGGYAEERKENERWNRRERKKMRDGVNATIKLRNKHRKLKDQLSLIPTSESEDDTPEQRKKLAIDVEDSSTQKKKLATEVDDPMWDEVSGDVEAERALRKKSKAKALVDEKSVNVQESSESSNDLTSTESSQISERNDDDMSEISMACEIDSLDNISAQHSSEELNIREIFQNKEPERSDNKLEKENTDSQLSKDSGKLENTDINFILSKDKIQTEKVNVFQAFKDSVNDSQDIYKPTIEAIRNIAKNPETPFEQFINEKIKANKENDQDNYEPLKELEDIMNILTDNQERVDLPAAFSIKNVKEAIFKSESDLESFEVNEKVKADFEELSNNMAGFVKQLDADRRERQEVFKALFTKSTAAKESSSENSDKEDMESLHNTKAERQIEIWDKETRLTQKKIDENNGENDQGDNEFQLKMKNVKREEQEIEKNKATETVSSNVQLKGFEYMPMDITLLTRTSNEALISLERKSEELKRLLQKLEVDNDDLFKDINADIKCQSDEKRQENQDNDQLDESAKNENLSLEKGKVQVDHNEVNTHDEKSVKSNEGSNKNEEAKLDNLDQHDGKEEFLEEIWKRENNDELGINKNHNETLSPCLINIELTKNQESPSLKDMINRNASDSSPNENLENLTIKLQEGIKIGMFLENEREKENQKSGKEDNIKLKRQIELWDKQTCSKNCKENQQGDNENNNPDKFVKQIVEELVESLELIPKSYNLSKILEEFEKEEMLDETLKADEEESKSIPQFLKTYNQFFKNIDTLEKYQQKSRILKELSKQSILKEFNKDTHESLDAQLDQIKRDHVQQVSQIVDRVYAKKERYNDTLELVDERLMIRDHESNELRELPNAKAELFNDSDTDYDTAQSEEEENEHNYCMRLKKNLAKDRNPYKPTARKSNEELIIQALKENNIGAAAKDDSEDSGDEFYSLDVLDSANLSNIDKEFFQKLKLENLDLTPKDGNHIVQCARSYEELKQFLTTSKDERRLTQEENELLEDMIERKNVETYENLSFLQGYKEATEIETVCQENDMSLKDNSLEANDQEYEKACEGNSLGCNDQEKTLSAIDNDPVKMMKQILLKTLVDTKENLEMSKAFREQRKLNKIKSVTSLIGERSSEEEKNEMETNIDLESTSAKCFKYKENHEQIVEGLNKIIHEAEEFPSTEDSEVPTEATARVGIEFVNEDGVIDHGSLEGIETLECNLEIIGDDDEILDTITVNAEVNF